MRARRPSAGALVALSVLVVLGAALRFEVAQQSLFGDELATFWVITTRDLDELLATIRSDAEISPPLPFVLSWLAVELGDPVLEFARLPAFVAGVALIGVVYATGVRVSGRPAGLTAAGITAFAPFLVFYSGEARGYALMMTFVGLATLALLLAVQDGRRRWWVLYGVASCAAAYTHYTCVFALAFQFGWLVWAHPEARRPALLANVAAAVAYVPWLPGLRADLDSPTTDILSALAPFTWDTVGTALVHWTVGYPYSNAAPVTAVPGIPALVLGGLAVLAALVAVVLRARRSPAPALAAPSRLAGLVAGLAVAVPAGEALVSAFGSDLFSTRNLAGSWPGLAVLLAVVLVSSGPRLRYLTAGAAVLAFAIGGATMLDDDHGRPSYEQMAEFINGTSRPGDVVIDETAIVSPGPLSHIDPYLIRRGPVFRSLKPQVEDRPFTVFDRDVPIAEAARKALAAAGGNRIFVATDAGRASIRRPLGDFRLIERRRWPGILPIEVQVYAPPSSSRR